MSTSTPAHILSGFQAVQQWLAILGPVSDEFLSEDQKTYLSSITAGVGILTQFLQEQSNISAVTLADLDAKEVLIVADDLKAQAQILAEGK